MNDEDLPRFAGRRTGAAAALAQESRWYAEHTALLISTLKWALLGAVAGICVGGATRGFLAALAWSSALVAPV